MPLSQEPLSNAQQWRVLRLDDNDNTFVMATCATEAEAKAMAKTFEDRRHKQTYWVEQVKN